MLQIDHLKKNYGRFTALHDLSLSIARGQLHGFVGPNGAGKTTTMRILATLLPASGGDATIDGISVRKNPTQVRRIVGYMPDFFGVYDGLKVHEYLDFYGSCYDIPVRERTRMANQLLELVMLENKRDAYVDTLSRGMKQRLCLARSLMHDPSLLILDEPASGMDPRARAEMRGILQSLSGLGKTVLISSHILPELAEMCDSLSIIDGGKLIFSGTIEALSEHMHRQSPLLLRIDGETDEAVRLLKESAGVSSLMQLEDGTLSADFTGDAASLLASLVGAGVRISDFHRAPINLETVFMEVTEHDA